LKTLRLCIPLYNEEKAVEPLLNSLQILGSNPRVHLVLVDNGSRDQTREAVQNYRARSQMKVSVVELDENAGYGGGILAGLKGAKEDYVGWVHADAPEAAGLVAELMEICDSDQIDVLKGARVGRSPSARLFANLLRFGILIIFGILLRDPHGQPTLVRKDLFFSVKSLAVGFEFDSLVTIQLARARAKFKWIEVPDEKREYGRSSWNTGLASQLGLGFRILAQIIKVRVLG